MREKKRKTEIRPILDMASWDIDWLCDNCRGLDHNQCRQKAALKNAGFGGGQFVSLQ